MHAQKRQHLQCLGLTLLDNGISGIVSKIFGTHPCINCIANLSVFPATAVHYLSSRTSGSGFTDIRHVLQTLEQSVKIRESKATRLIQKRLVEARKTGTLHLMAIPYITFSDWYKLLTAGATRLTGTQSTRVLLPPR